MADAQDDSVRAKLFQARVLLINGDLDGAVANRVCADLLLLAAVDPAAGMFLYIDSPGGRLTAGLAVRDTIKYLQADVTTVVIGVAAGAAQLVFSAGTPGRRCALSHARIRLTLPAGASPSPSDPFAPDPFAPDPSPSDPFAPDPSPSDPFAAGSAAGSADAAWDDRVLRMIAEDTGLPFGQVAMDAREGRWFTAGRPSRTAWWTGSSPSPRPSPPSHPTRPARTGRPRFRPRTGPRTPPRRRHRPRPRRPPR
ncbi:ATP-dependent Clp protease proteolytic subunit [Actinomadura yumaensis]|uniref:ClpP family protease n=1 Tax=Actinomadura yumaensis TaxID=111807 RepID=UPI003621953E